MQSKQRILLVYQSEPVLVEPLAKAFIRQGYSCECFLADQHHHWIDKYIFHFINKLGHNLRLLPKYRFWFSKHRLAHQNYLDTELLRFYKNYQPNFVFFIHGIVYAPEVMKQILCPKIAWLVDPVFEPKRLLQFVNGFDWYFSYSTQSLSTLDRVGFKNFSYLSHSVDKEAFFFNARIKSIDLVFVGKHSVHREEFIRAALKITNNIHVYGGRWLVPALKYPPLLKILKGTRCQGTKLNNLYNCSKVVLSIVAKAQVGFANSGINMRPFEVMAAGSCLLTDDYVELKNLTGEVDCLVSFSTPKDFQEKLANLLHNEEFRESLSHNGRQFIANKFSYAEMAKTITSKFAELRSIKPY